METNKKYTIKKSFISDKIMQTFLVISLLLLSILMLMPFFWAFATSLRLPKDSFSLPPSFFPTEWRWDNYVYVFNEVPLLKYMTNSLKVVSSIVIVQLLFSSMAAFAFARLKFKGKNLLFIYILSGLMIPFQSIIVAQFMLISKAGMVDNHIALILPYLANPFGIFLLKQYMQGIPKSYDDAAVIDGCNKFRIYWNVIMPMCKPSLIVVAFMKFIEQWNNFFSPLIYINSMEKYTLPMGMQVLKGFRSSGSLAHILAGVMISMIVPAIVYIFGQKYLIKGTMLSGIKG
jgi:multiple sugar transport system permease protein